MTTATATGKTYLVSSCLERFELEDFDRLLLEDSNIREGCKNGKENSRRMAARTSSIAPFRKKIESNRL